MASLLKTLDIELKSSVSMFSEVFMGCALACAPPLGAENIDGSPAVKNFLRNKNQIGAERDAAYKAADNENAPATPAAA